MILIRLAHIYPKKRKRRFYNFAIYSELFGGWIFEREWGRQGSQGRVAKEVFHEIEPLLRALCVKVNEKVRRGYVLNYVNQQFLEYFLAQNDHCQSNCEFALRKLIETAQRSPSGNSRHLSTAASALESAGKTATDIGSISIYSVLQSSIELTAARENLNGRMLENPAIVQFIPKTAYSFLDFSLRDFLGCDDTQLNRLISLLDEIGVSYVGQLISLNLSVLRNRYPRLKNAIVSMKLRLQEAGLNFGGRAPGWKPPSRSESQGLNQSGQVRLARQLSFLDLQRPGKVG
jgi:predicted DNA-binding WGR domain protein